MNPTQAKFHEDLDKIADQLDVGVKAGKFSWRDVQERLKDTTTSVASDADRYLHEYTWTSIGIVAGLSAIVGFFLARR